jgi:tetraacyldisaccharide 4'-kinase
VTLRQSFLRTLAPLYEVIVRVRARAYRNGMLRQRKLDGVVISVGNLTTGGTGKTPMVLWLAQKLLEQGQSVGILTRGYGGRANSFGSTSDEVQLLQARLGDGVAFGVGGNRFTRGRALTKRGVQWFLLDDGFQHRQLKRDVDIVLIDATNPFGGGELLPAGRLREPTSALALADIVVITRSEHAPEVEAAVRQESHAPIFYARPEFDGILLEPRGRDARPERIVRRDSHPRDPDPVELDAQQSSKVFLFCGIGNPSAFQADAKNWNFRLEGQKFFPDHHRYTVRDLQEIEAEALQAKATVLVCTEKDVYNLPDAPRGKLDICFLRMKLHICREDEFWQTILTTIEHRSSSAGKPPRTENA